MSTAPPELAKPVPGVNDGIRTNTTEHTELVKGVTDAVNEAGIPVTAESITPVTDGVPISESPALTQANACRVGSEEPSIIDNIHSERRNIHYFLNMLRKFITGGGSWLRHAPGKVGRGLANMRMQSKDQVKNKYDPNQMDIGG